jgi:hypothetical protein
LALSTEDIEAVRRQTLQLRAEFLEQVDNHLDKLLEKVASFHKTADEVVISDDETSKDKRPVHKVFVERESLLTYVNEFDVGTRVS